MKYVLDASVAVRWFVSEERHENADAVLERIVNEPELFAVPELFAYEVFAVLFRVHPNPLAVFLEGFSPLLNSGLLRYPMTDAVAKRASRFLSLGLTGYDAVYVGMAEELGALWLTFDEQAHKRLAKESISVDLNSTLPQDW